MKTITLKTTGLLFAVIACIVVAFAITGCTAQEQEQTQEATSEQHEVVGFVSSISGDEMEVDVTSDSDGALLGAVRVDISAIDAAVVDSIMVGSEVEVIYSGQVGMSEPPFISAQSVTIL